MLDLQSKNGSQMERLSLVQAVPRVRVTLWPVGEACCTPYLPTIAAEHRLELASRSLPAAVTFVPAARRDPFARAQAILTQQSHATGSPH